MTRDWFVDKMPNEVSYDDIEKKSSEFHQWGFVPLSTKEMGYEGVLEKLKTYTAEKYEVLDDSGKEAMINEVLAIYRSVNLLPIQYYNDLGVMNEIERCIEYKAEFNGDTVSCVSGDTEFFDGEVWKPISEYVNGDKVLQYNEDGTATLVEPLRYIHYQSDDPFYEKSNPRGNKYLFGYGAKLTGNHNVVYYDDGKLLKDELVNLFESRKGVVYIPLGCQYDGCIDVDESVLVSIYVAVVTNKMIHDCEYVTMYDGEVGFSDKCMSMSLKSKRYLLNLFGLNIDVLSELSNEDNVFAPFFNRGVKVVESFNSILESTYNGFALDFLCFNRRIDSNNSYMFYNDEFMSVSKGDYDVSYEKDKYCFTVPSGMLVLRRKGNIFITGNCGAGVGTTLCDYLFPNLYDVPSKHDLDKKDAETMFKKFHNDDYLKRAIKFCFSYKDGCPIPTNVTGGLRLVGSAPTNFRPMNAKAVYERFCPEGGTVYDFCCCDGKTEYFNGKEWVALSDYREGDKVLQYNEDGSAELVDPIEYIHYQSDEPFYLYDSENLNTCLTGNHDVVSLIYDGNVCDFTGVRKVKMIDVVNGDEDDVIVPRSFYYGGNTVEPVDLLMLMLCLCQYSDCNNFSNSCDIRTVVIDFATNELGRLDLELFLELLIKLKKSGYKDVSFLYDGDTLTITCEKFKKYFYREEDGSFCLNRDAWLSLSIDTKVDLAEELTSTSEGDNLLSYCNSEEDMITRQMLASSMNFGVHVYEKTDHSPRLLVDTCSIGVGYYYRVPFKEVHDKDKYCFVVPSHMLVLRREEKIFVTGNCGFGGRMLGCLSSKKNFRYVGTDPCTETMYHLHELGDYIEMVTGRDDSYELHCCGSEDFVGPEESIDFAFSSPPYFDLEVYSSEETQCFNKFPKLEEWLEGYVRATIKNIHRMLKRGAVYAVNIADFTVGGGKECAYVDEWIRISTEEGMPLYDTVYLGVTARAGSKQQAAGELKKENILIFKKPL